MHILYYLTSRFNEYSKKDNFISVYEMITQRIWSKLSPFHEKDITFDDDLNINHWLEQWNDYKDCYET